MKDSQTFPRRELLRQGARVLGAVALGGTTIDLLASGCARQPPGGANLSQRLMHVQFSVQGQMRSTTASPFYYLCVINLTNNRSDPGPVPIVNAVGNGIAAPAAVSGTYQTFVGYIQYDTGLQNYTVYTCPIIGSGASAVFESAVQVSSYTLFNQIGSPDSAILPTAGVGNTFDATIDLNRLKPYTGAALPQYAQVNFITYNYLASGSDFNGTHYWDGIGNGTRTTNDYAIVDTTTTESVLSSNFIDQQGDVQNQVAQPVAVGSDPAIANLYITSWAVAMQS